MPSLHDLSPTTLLMAGIVGAVILLLVILLIRRQLLLRRHRRMRAMVYKQKEMSGDGVPAHHAQQLIDLLYDLLNDDPDPQHQHIYNTLLLTARQLLTPTAPGGKVSEGSTEVSGAADTSGTADMSGNSGVTRTARILGNADISGTANTSSNSGVTGTARVSGNTHTSGNSEISNTAHISTVEGSDATAESTTPASAPAMTPEGVSIAATDTPRLAIVLVDLGEELTQHVIRLAGKIAHLILSTTASDALDAIVTADPTVIICVNSTPCRTLATTIRQDIFLSHIPIIAIALTDDPIFANEVIPFAMVSTDLERALSRLAGIPQPPPVAPPAQPTHSNNTNTIIITARPQRHDSTIDAAVLAVSDSQLLTQLRQAIQQHLADSTLNAETLAHELDIPKDTILIKVKEITGHTLWRLIHQERLAKAVTLLRENHLPVDAIAEQVGYANYNAFAAAFKDEYHVSPYAYRPD